MLSREPKKGKMNLQIILKFNNLSSHEACVFCECDFTSGVLEFTLDGDFDRPVCVPCALRRGFTVDEADFNHLKWCAFYAPDDCVGAAS